MTFTVRSGHAGHALPPSSVEVFLPAPGTTEVDTLVPVSDSGQPVSPEAETPASWQLVPPNRERARSLVTTPAIGLLLVGIIGLVLDLLQAVIWSTKPELFDEQITAMKALGLGQAPSSGFMAAAYGICVVLSALTILGSIGMLRLRGYGIALTASALSMINCGSSCCFVGLPLGIWALVVLLRPEVRSSFE